MRGGGVGGFSRYSDDTEKPKSGMKEGRAATFSSAAPHIVTLALTLNIKKNKKQKNCHNKATVRHLVNYLFAGVDWI